MKAKMKKAITVFVVMNLALSTFSLGLDAHLGMVSGFGIQQKCGKATFGLDIESTFPVYSIVDGISGMMFNDIPFWDGFLLGSGHFIGLDLYAYMDIIQNGAFTLSGGFDLLMGTETPIHNFEAVLKPSVRASFKLSPSLSLFGSEGVSLVDFLMVKGFAKPLIRIPEVNYASILTGSKLGIAINI